MCGHAAPYQRHRLLNYLQHADLHWIYLPPRVHLVSAIPSPLSCLTRSPLMALVIPVFTVLYTDHIHNTCVLYTSSVYFTSPEVRQQHERDKQEEFKIVKTLSVKWNSTTVVTDSQKLNSLMFIECCNRLES